MKYTYVHDGYGNEAYETEDPIGEWESLKGLGGDWAEIGQLTAINVDERYQNETGEDVFVATCVYLSNE